jgi:hypothetical protein
VSREEEEEEEQEQLRRRQRRGKHQLYTKIENQNMDN